MSQTAAATLNAGQIAFYATTATVIPVFVLAYVVQSRQLTTSLYRIGRDATAQTPEATVAKPSRKDRGGALARLRRMTVATAGLNPLIIVLFFLPVFGEFTALHALLTDQSMGRASSGPA